MTLPLPTPTAMQGVEAMPSQAAVTTQSCLEGEIYRHRIVKFERREGKFSVTTRGGCGGIFTFDSGLRQ